MSQSVVARRAVGGRRYQIDTDPDRLDFAVTHRLLAECSHWARDIPRETLHRALAHSLVFGLYREDGQIGFARVVTDRATVTKHAKSLYLRCGFAELSREVD